MCKLRIKELAKAKHITMSQVATAAGYRQATSLNQKMSGKGLTTSQLEAIAKLLGVEVADLFVRHIKCPHCGHEFEIEIKTK